MNELYQKLKSIKEEKILLRRLEAKLIAEMKKGHMHVAEALEYIKDRKMQLAFEEAKLLVQIKRMAVA